MYLCFSDEVFVTSFVSLGCLVAFTAFGASSVVAADNIPDAPSTKTPIIDDSTLPSFDVGSGSVTGPYDPQSAEVLAFADHLLLDGDYYRAITEYRRYLFLERGRGPQSPRAALAIGEALLRGGQYDAAGRQFDGIAVRALDVGLKHTALYGAAKSYLYDGRPEMAKPRLRMIAEDPAASAALKEEATWLLAWGHFDAGELALAEQIFRDIAKQDGVRAQSAAAAAEKLGTEDEIEFKDPAWAGVLSVVPGGGHFYLGQWGVGTASLIWNGLFIYATTSAVLSQDYGTAAVLGSFELGWYAGGIFGAVSGAYKQNRDAVRNWRDDVLQSHATARDLPNMRLLPPEIAPGTLLHLAPLAHP